MDTVYRAMAPAIFILLLGLAWRIGQVTSELQTMRRQQQALIESVGHLHDELHNLESN